MTIELGVDDFILKKFGEEKIKEYLNKMLTVKRLEFFTETISKAIDMPEEEYEEQLEEIRQEAWEEYKKNLSL